MSAAAAVADVIGDVRFIPFLMILAAAVTMLRHHTLVTRADPGAILGKVVPASLAAGGLGLSLVGMIRLVHLNDPNFCAELSRTELASMYALATVVAFAGGMVALLRTLSTSGPVAPPPTEQVQPAAEQDAGK